MAKVTYEWLRAGITFHMKRNGKSTDPEAVDDTVKSFVKRYYNLTDDQVAEWISGVNRVSDPTDFVRRLMAEFFIRDDDEIILGELDDTLDDLTKFLED